MGVLLRGHRWDLENKRPLEFKQKDSRLWELAQLTINIGNVKMPPINYYNNYTVIGLTLRGLKEQIIIAASIKIRINSLRFQELKNKGKA